MEGSSSLTVRICVQGLNDIVEVPEEALAMCQALIPAIEQYREDPTQPISIDPGHVSPKVLRKVVQLATSIHAHPELQLAKTPVDLAQFPQQGGVCDRIAMGRATRRMSTEPELPQKFTKAEEEMIENFFMDVDEQEMLALMRAADYLNFGQLLLVVTRRIADRLFGEEVEDFCRSFNLPVITPTAHTSI